TRLAAKRPVLFIEEPVRDEAAEPSWERRCPEAHVLVCRPHTNLSSAGFTDEQWPTLKRLLHQLFREEAVDDYLLWFYTPMALPLAEDLRPQAIVYDCMDELSAFLMAPPQLLQREVELLQRA